MLRVGKFGGWDFVGGCPKCPKLGIGHFGHIRFKIFLIFDFDGHLVTGWCCLIDGEFLGT